MPLSSLPTGTVSPREDDRTRPRDRRRPAPTTDGGSAENRTPTDRDVYVAELEHENAALRAELNRRAERERRPSLDPPAASDAEPRRRSVSGDSLTLRLARLLGLR